MKIARRRLKSGVPSVAMADIAFNLVLFFIMMAKTQDDSHLQWPYWIVLLVPWLTLTAAFLLEHLNICLICLPAGGVALP